MRWPLSCSAVREKKKVRRGRKKCPTPVRQLLTVSGQRQEKGGGGGGREKKKKSLTVRKKRRKGGGPEHTGL